MDICEYCNNFAYDEEEECYICAANLDEEMYRFVSSHYRECPYFRNGDEYKIVRKQM